MNRLQKKCFTATAGIHLLLLVILVVGPAFFRPRMEADNMTVLDVIPSNLIDAQFNQGVRGAQPPPPTPVVTPPQPQPQQQPQPAPPQPKPPEPDNQVKLDLKPIVKPVKPEPHKIQVNTKLVTYNAPQNNSTPDNTAAKARALRKALQNLKNNFSTSTKVDLPGNSTAAYANYAEVVKSVYDQAWVLPDAAYPKGAITKVIVTIASDGTVISARITSPSGDEKLDDSIRRTLERVTFIAPFPEGAAEKERTYPISFNPEIKQMLE